MKIFEFKSSLYSRYYAEACNEWRGPSPGAQCLGDLAPKKRHSTG